MVVLLEEMCFGWDGEMVGGGECIDVVGDWYGVVVFGMD